jgi:hypothetical protein
MAESPCVRPALDTLTLSTGDTVTILHELNAGEYWDLLQARAARESFALILAYAVSWSLVGLDGQPLPYSLELPLDTRRDTVRGLNKRIVRELVARLTKHEEAEEAQHDAKKKIAAAAPASNVISASPAAATGVLSGSDS